jgi:hypothetical protein
MDDDVKQVYDNILATLRAANEALVAMSSKVSHTPQVQRAMAKIFDKLDEAYMYAAMPLHHGLQQQSQRSQAEALAQAAADGSIKFPGGPE